MTYIVKLQQINVSYKQVHGENEEDALRVARNWYLQYPDQFTFHKGEVHAIDVDTVGE